MSLATLFRDEGVPGRGCWFMKLSAVFLLSVNVVAATQVAAVAADCSDTASFLQESLSGAKATPAPALRPSTAVSKISHSAAQPVAPSRKLVPMVPVADKSVKLRPFMPGRYLPSEGDLYPRAAVPESLGAQPAPLSGQVSASANAYSKVPTTYASDYVDQLALAAARKVKNVARKFAAAPKTTPGSAPVLPGQFGGAANQPAVPALANLIGADQSAQSLPQLPALSPSVTVPAPPSATRVSPVVVPPPPQVAAFPTVPPPNLSSYEEAKMARLVEANLPERLYANGSNGDMRASSRVNPGLAGAGPPPFPLSLMAGQMPAAGGRMRPAPGMEAKFGNWHDRNNLPSAAFHTYLSQAKMAGPLAVSRTMQSKGSRRTGRQSASAHSAAPAHHVASVASSIKVPKKTAVKNAVVACYPHYHRYPGL